MRWWLCGAGWGFRKSNHLYQMHHITPTVNKIWCQHVASLTLVMHAVLRTKCITLTIPLSINLYQDQWRFGNRIPLHADVHGQGTGTEIFHRMLYKLHFQKEYGWSRKHVEPHVKSLNHFVVEGPLVVMDHFVNHFCLNQLERRMHPLLQQ